MNVGLLLRWLLRGHWRAQPGRTVAAVAAVAVGVALALGIHLVNDSALAAFRQAIATVNGVADEAERSRFWINVIPHTQGATTLGALEPGMAVNIEIDVLARYLRRMEAYRAQA